MRLSSLALSSLLVASTQAWVSAPSFTAKQHRLSDTTRLYSTTEEEKTTTTYVSENLKPEYAAALEQANAKLEASIPEDYHDTMLPLLTHFAQEYLHAHQDAYEAGKDKEQTNPGTAAKRFLTCIGYGLKYGLPQSPDHYTFDVSHTALRGTEPDNEVDYYQFGCEFFHYCMDLTSPEVNVLGADNLEKAVEQIENGENVVFFANHQSEADPQVASSCFELAGHKKLGEDMVYVAGHKVTTDPLAVPFSMGRNLICIHSKKHINADPDTKPMKQRQNLKAMQALLKGFKKGGSCIWVAPSGGRDRRNVETGEVPLADFDTKTIDMFRLMANKSGVKTHYYTMAMDTYELCPPPDTIESGVGESRNVRFVPVGVAIGEELESVGGLESRRPFCDHAFEQCQEDYEKLQSVLQQK